MFYGILVWCQWVCVCVSMYVCNFHYEKGLEPLTSSGAFGITSGKSKYLHYVGMRVFQV